MLTEAQKRKQEYLSNAKAQLTLTNFIIYTMMLFGLFGLGLLNWTEWKFDLGLLTVAYLVSFGIEVFSYGNMIVSMSTYQLQKRKKTSEELYEVEQYNKTVVDNVRTEHLDDYVFNDNMNEKKKAFLNKYKFLIAKLEKKNNNEETQRSWRDYQKDIKLALENKAELPEPPNKYCRLKEEYLDKINRVEELYENEHIEYDELSVDDLLIGIGKKGTKRIPRESEGGSLTFGVLRGLIVMSIGGLLTTILIINLRMDGLDAIVKTLLTIFFSFVTIFKGLLNGERVFEFVTLRKALFRKKHLHGYCMYEIKENKYVVVPEEE